MQQPLPFTVLKRRQKSLFCKIPKLVLQQPLPFTVLKLTQCFFIRNVNLMLQQPLPFTVLKLSPGKAQKLNTYVVATALTVYGIETEYHTH